MFIIPMKDERLEVLLPWIGRFIRRRNLKRLPRTVSEKSKWKICCHKNVHDRYIIPRCVFRLPPPNSTSQPFTSTKSFFVPSGQSRLENFAQVLAAFFSSQRLKTAPTSRGNIFPCRKFVFPVEAIKNFVFVGVESHFSFIFPML